MGKSIFEGIKIEAGQKFNLLEAAGNPHYIDDDGVLRDCHDKEAQLWKWIDIARGDYAIIPPYTDDEIAILRGFRAAGYRYIARDEYGRLAAYEVKPEKSAGAWNEELAAAGIKREMMPGIRWEDPEPLDIAAALDEIDREEQDR